MTPLKIEKETAPDRITLLTSGTNSLNAGNFSTSEAIFRELLRHYKNDGDALHFLGLSQHLQGRSADGVKSIKKALKKAGLNPDVLNNLGQILGQLGRHQEAVKVYRSAIKLAPKRFDIINNLGNALASLGRERDAISQFKKALKLNPLYVNSLYCLGTLYFNMKDYEDAAALLKKAVQGDPNHCDALHNLGLSLMSLRQYTEAIQAFRQELAVNPRSVPAWTDMSKAYVDHNQIDEALACLDKASSIAPNDLKVQNGYVFCYRILGQFDKAANMCRQMLRTNPLAVDAYLNLGNMNKLDGEGRDITAMEHIASHIDLQKLDRATLLFALHTAHEEQKNFAAAFRYLDEANALVRAHFAFDIEAVRTSFETLKRIFSEQIWKDIEFSGSSSATPIFIVGMPRTGSTLVEQIIASHGQAEGVGESQAFLDIAGKCFSQVTSKNQNFSIENMQKGLLKNDFKMLGDEYIASTSTLNGNFRRIIDKQLENFVHIGLINFIFPNARIIHTRRNPFATCFSCYSTRFTEGLKYAFNLNELAQYYLLYSDLMHHWQNWSKVPILDVDYEQMVENQDAETRRIIAFCGLRWDEKCLSFHQTERIVKTASDFQVRQPLYTSKLEHWKNYSPYLKPLFDVLNDG